MGIGRCDRQMKRAKGGAFKRIKRALGSAISKWKGKLRCRGSLAALLAKGRGLGGAIRKWNGDVAVLQENENVTGGAICKWNGKGTWHEQNQPWGSKKQHPHLKSPSSHPKPRIQTHKSLKGAPPLPPGGRALAGTSFFKLRVFCLV